MIPIPFNVGFGAFGGSPFSQTMQGFNSWSGSATADLAPFRMWLVSRARQLVISNPIASAAVKRITSGIVGEGLSYIPTDETKDIAKRFNFLSHLKVFDAQKRLTFAQMQELACRNWMLSGDVFFIRKDRGDDDYCGWRAIESDRVQSPYFYAQGNDIDGYTCTNPDTGNRIIDGVEVDSEAIPCAYWILKDYIATPWLVTVDQIERVPAYDEQGMPLVLHLFKPQRPDQYRGIPLLAESLESLFGTTGFIRSTEQAAQFQSSVWGFITSENPTFDETEALGSRDLDAKIPVSQKTDSTPAGTPTMTLSTDPPTEADQRALMDKVIPKAKTIGAGELWNLKAGEDVKFLQPTNPNPQFEAYIKAQTGMVAGSIGIPLQVLSCNFDGTYASARGSVLEANAEYKRCRSFFIESFVKPIFERFIYDYTKDQTFAQWMGLLSQWQAPTTLCLDPTKEIDAWTKAIQLGLCTRDEAAQALYGHKATGTPENPSKTVEVEEI